MLSVSPDVRCVDFKRTGSTPELREISDVLQQLHGLLPGRNINIEPRLDGDRIIVPCKSDDDAENVRSIVLAKVQCLTLYSTSTNGSSQSQE